MKVLKTVLILAAVPAVVACGRTDRAAKNDDFHQRWVEMYGDKTWEQVQRDNTERTAEAAAADRAATRLFTAPLTDKDNPWAKDIARQQRH